MEEIMKEIQFSIEINANKERVWATLWEDTTFRDWANLIDEGMYMKGVMKEGHEIQFISSINGYGVTSLIEKLTPNEFVLLKHEADTKDSGLQEREKEWTGGTESYSLTEKNGITTLIVKTDVPQEQEEAFHSIFTRALERIKTLAEKMQFESSNVEIESYNASQADIDRKICNLLMDEINRNLVDAKSKIWHGSPVWFLDGNPIVGYCKLKNCIQLLFWSGQTFYDGLKPVGKYKAAEARFNEPDQINIDDLARWLHKSIEIQWDYKNMVKRNGSLELLNSKMK